MLDRTGKVHNRRSSGDADCIRAYRASAGGGADWGIAVAAAAAAVVSLITNTIGALLGTANGLLGSINGFVQALANLWQNVVYPINLINQALAMVNQLIAQFRGLVAAIDNVNVRSATLAESICARSDHAERVSRGFCAVRPGFQDDVPAAARRRPTSIPATASEWT